MPKDSRSISRKKRFATPEAKRESYSSNNKISELKAMAKKYEPGTMLYPVINGRRQMVHV